MKGAWAWGESVQKSETRRKVGSLFTGEPTYDIADMYDIIDKNDELYSCCESSTK